MHRLLCPSAGPAAAGFAADGPRLNKALNEQIVFVRSGSGLFVTELETTIFKPDGDGRIRSW